MRTRLEILCELHGQSGGTIHEFNAKYNTDFITLHSREFFKTIYAIQLKRVQNQFPDLYSWPSGELLSVLEKMCRAIDKKSFNKDSAAFKLTCKVLGIKHTYSEIFKYCEL